MRKQLDYQSVDVSNIMDIQVTLLTELYQVIEQRAQMHGCSVSTEISSILAASVGLSQDELTEEFNNWEAASDEDWLKMEAVLTAEASV